ncbi:MAG: BON domain-containing protein [Xenococcaceae cyanobacterium MO_188.B19]|nr:BON domain-containing protein [Xenococcaceae cyanobacterium MO_188.B19]
MKLRYGLVSIRSIILIPISFLIITGYKKITTEELSTIPKERIGIDGRYTESGLATRISKSLREDEILIALDYDNNVHIAQSGRKIILKGTVTDKYTLERVVNIARAEKGVKEVNAEQIIILQESKNLSLE